MKRFRYLLIAAPVAVLPLIVLPFVAVAQVPSTVEHYDSAAKAGAVHIYAYDNSLQFATVDSSFPLAYSSQAGGGGLGYSSATGSYYDYGPAGVTVLGVPDGQGPPANSTGVSPAWIPPAKADYPGRGQSTLYPGQCPSPTLNPPNNPCPDFGKPGPAPASGPYATAAADEMSAKAFATFSNSVGGAFQGLTSETSSVIAADGSITTTAHSYASEITIGPFVFQKIDVTSVVSSAGGSARVVQSRVAIGSVQANGNTVELTDQGLTIGPVQSTQPVSVTGTQSAGFVTYTAELVAPEQKVQDAEASLVDTGIKLTANTQDPATGHSVTVEYDLGYASVDASLSPNSNESLGGLSVGIPGGLGSLSGTGPLTAGNFPSTLAPPAQPIKAGPVPKLYLAAQSRKPLAMAFLGWEALVMCGVAAWVWARKTVGVA